MTIYICVIKLIAEALNHFENFKTPDIMLSIHTES